MQWDQLCAKEAVNGFQTTLQGKADHLITNDWEQLQNQCHLIKAHQALPQFLQNSTEP